MASISKRDNGQWRARYRDTAGKEHARHFARKIDAQQWIDGQTASIVRGDWADPARGRRTVKTWAADWEAVQVSSEGTARIVDNALRLHVVPYLGHHQLGGVRPSHIQAMVKHLIDEKGLAPGSVRNIYDVTAALFARRPSRTGPSRCHPAGRCGCPEWPMTRSTSPRSKRSRGCGCRWMSAGDPS
jgi:hypothetical protein